VIITYKRILFILLILLTVFKSYGQNVLYTPVSLSKSTGSTLEILSELEIELGIVFSYSNQLCLQDQVSLTRSSALVKEILNELFIDCPAQYIVKGNKIILEARRDIKRYTIKGYIRDRKTFESLIQANLYEPDHLSGTVSNNFGFFSISLPEGRVRLKCSYVGYNPFEKDIILTQDTLINFALAPKIELDEIAVVGLRVPGRVKSTRTGTVNVPMDQIKGVPVFLGEVDVVKSLQLLPGIQSGGEGISGLYVRGGGPDQNLVLMDDVPVYNVGHMLGFFSIFNADAINNVTVIKGGFPARYGGRLSSVVDIRMYDGNAQEYKGSASIGLLSSRLALEGPLVKDKASFSVSFRRTYFDLITSSFQINSDEKSRYYFYDFNTKFNYRFSEKDRVYVSTYNGKDMYALEYNEQEIPIKLADGISTNETVTTRDVNDLGWQNFVAAARWNHIFGDKMFSNLTLTYSNYKFLMQQKNNYQKDENWVVTKQKYFSGIRDLGAKIDIDYYSSPNHYIRFGGSFTFHTFYPGIDLEESQIANEEPVDTVLGGNNMYRPEMRLYFEDDFLLFPRLKINIGGHFSAFQTENKLYWSAEPRLSARYLIHDRISLKAAYSEMTQYMHLLRTSTVSMPTDMWLPVSDEIKPMRSSQAALGFEYEIRKGINLSIEGYYKNFRDILTYKESAGFFDFSSDWKNKLTSGKGESYGVELLVHKKSGKLSGWLGYTWSNTTNQFAEINDGKEYDADFDRTHDVSIFTSYKFSPKVDLGMTWMFGTGSPITLPESKYHAPDLPTAEQPIYKTYNQHFSKRNGYRMPNFHRMDIGVNFKKQLKRGSRIWSIGVINLYGRQNPFFLYVADDINEKTGEDYRSLKQFSIFPFPLPYVRYTIRF